MSVAGIAPRPARATRPVRAAPPVVMSAPLLLLFLLQSTLASSQLHSVTAVAGGAVSLDCPLDLAPHTACHWTKDGFVLSTEQAGYSRHSTTGENCQLVIEPVLAVDRGEYGCQVPGSRSPPLTLTVHTPPSRPTILQSASQGRDWLRLPPGNPVVLDCEAGGASPAGEIHWWDANTGERITADVVETVTRERGGHAFTTTSKLSFTPEAEMAVHCSVQSSAFPAGKDSAPLRLLLTGEPSTEEMQLSEGDSVKIFCQTDGASSGAQEDEYKWFVNGVELFDEKKDSLEITQFTESYDKTKVKCAVTNPTGEEEVVRVVQLNFQERNRRSGSSKPLPLPVKNLEKETTDVVAAVQKYETNHKKAKTTFLCIVEDDDETATEPKYVWIDGELKAAINDANQDKKYKCRVVKNGSKRIGKMAADLKKVSKQLRRFSKTLSEITNI